MRPSLAILFRMAVGPGADYYAPRFLEYERIGRSFPDWNWAPLLAPGAWAIYRRLWLPGIAFALWPLLAVAAFNVVEPRLGRFRRPVACRRADCSSGSFRASSPDWSPTPSSIAGPGSWSATRRP